MRLDADELSANERVAGWVLQQYRADCKMRTSVARPELTHLATCSDVIVTPIEAYDGLYGCDTGCEYARLEVVISCPHGEREEFDYGTFGELADILEEIAEFRP